MARHDLHTAWAAFERHEVEMATVRDFAERSGAVRVVALVDAGDGRTASLVEALPGGPVRLSEGGATYEVPTAVLEAIEPRPLHPPLPLPPSAWHVDAESGEVVAPIGAVSGLGMAVLELAAALGGRSVATADFATDDGMPVTIAARPGEPLILAVGEQQFELPAGPA